ncbi:MAG: alpha/beta hydrolase [Acidimicrobiia bacterium]|nr:alpha/beta hydrolase [Acidimicrobiia bacterium]
MPIDPIAAGLLQQMAEAGMPPLNEMSPADARQAAEGFRALAGEGEPVADVTNRTIPGPGGDIPVRIYTPAGAGGDALPCLVYYHGGGWVLGDIEGVDTICRAVANRAGCKVASVEYRLAPEHKFPAPFDDCYAALEWVAANGNSAGVDTSKLAVGGDSAGGNLAAAVALKARDAGGPALRHQLLVYPVTNHDYGTVSYRENGDGYLLTQDMMTWFWDHYLNDAEEGRNPLASPLAAGDLSGLPSALVITAEFDPLRDEGEAYAAKLAEAGVKVSHQRFDGQIHAFWQMPGVFPAALEAADRAAVELKAAFA